MADVVIAMGSNLGDSLEYLKLALLEIRQLGSVQKIASLYKSSAYGYRDQPDFLNTVLILNTNLTPPDLLNNLKEIERKLGRTATIRWGPREIDLDIILYNQQCINTAELTVPHPDFHNRIFVLQPLSEIALEMKSPVHNMSIMDLLGKCENRSHIEQLEKNWYSDESEL
jgi:2-amino-4-hydroxy-6-hydroxymethyldihydropteridine diphosphokinase